MFKTKAKIKQEVCDEILAEQKAELEKVVGDNYSVVQLREILNKNDIIEVVDNEGSPYILATPKTARSQPGLSMYDKAALYPDSVHYGAYNEPSHSERANGASVVPLPTSVAAQHVSLSDSRGNRMASDSARSEVDLNEIGSSSPSPWTSFTRREYNPDLLGMQGLRAYDKMRRNDGIVRGTLRSVKTPVLAARWFMEPKDKDKVADVNVANEIWENLTCGMSISWTQILAEAMLMCDFGYYMFEIVWQDTGDLFKLQKLAPRHPMDVKLWTYDREGGVNGAWFFAIDYGEPDVWIPIEKLLVFTFDREAGNMEGISLLRSAYKHWYFKEQLYKIDAIQKERHGIGVPIVILPVGFNDSDKLVAEAIGRNLRTNERAHVTLPPFWEIKFAELSGQPVSAIESINMHDNGIRENILLQFMDGNTNASGDDEKTAMFFKATRFIADIILSTFNLYLIPRYMDANYSRVGKPTLKARRIGESQDWRTLSFAVRNLLGCGAIIADDKLDAWLRDEMDMPEADPDTARPLPSLQPDNGTQDGTTNQKTQPTAGPGNRSGGTDHGGGGN